MAELRRAVRKWLKISAAVKQNPTYLVGLSGGGDSLALAWALSVEAPKLGVQVGAIIVNHQLQVESATVTARAIEQAEELGLAPIRVAELKIEGSHDLESRARDARYAAFNDAIRETEAAGIVLAHTLDDQAETFLIGLSRGSGPSSLKGMSRRDKNFHRPLLDLKKSTLRQALMDAGKDWWEDPANSDQRFTRVRVRENVLPILERELGPGIHEALARTAELFRIDSESLDSTASEWVDRFSSKNPNGSLTVPVDDLIKLDRALRSRALRFLVVSVSGRSPSYAQTQLMLGLLDQWKGQSPLDLSGAIVERKGNLILVSRRL